MFWHYADEGRRIRVDEKTGEDVKLFDLPQKVIQQCQLTKRKTVNDSLPQRKRLPGVSMRLVAFCVKRLFFFKIQRYNNNERLFQIVIQGGNLWKMIQN